MAVNFFGLCTFFHSKKHVQNLTKNGLGHTLGDFFANSSGRPGFRVLFLLMLGCLIGAKKYLRKTFLFAFHSIRKKIMLKHAKFNLHGGFYRIGPGDRWYDFKNIFAEKFGEKIGVFCSN
jgi:hypothetical protein